MIRWEYCEVVQSHTSGKLHYYGYESPASGTANLPATRDMIARLGEEGWEMVSVTLFEEQLHYYFKRLLEEQFPPQGL